MSLLTVDDDHSIAVEQLLQLSLGLDLDYLRHLCECVMRGTLRKKAAKMKDEDVVD